MFGKVWKWILFKKLVSKIIQEKQYIIRNKVRKTCLEKYGVDNYAKSEEYKNRINWEEQKKKEYETKKKNNSFNKSKIEIKSYELLKEKYPNVQYQYKSDAYPFVCDFFILSVIIIGHMEDILMIQTI